MVLRIKEGFTPEADDVHVLEESMMSKKDMDIHVKI